MQNQNNNPTLEQVAHQFAAVELAPRTEIWSKDIERATPSANGVLSAE